MFDISFFGAFLAGLASFITPCVLPLVPPYLAWIGGVSMDSMTGEDGPEPGARRAVMLAALAFVLGFATVFILLGATASTLGQMIADHKRTLTVIAGIIIMVLGLHFIGVVKIPLLYREARVDVQQKPAGMLGAYIVGLAFAFGWTPCVGPILSLILFQAGDAETVWEGAALLGFYAAGMGLPFLIAAAFMTQFMRAMKRIRPYMERIERGIGVILYTVGLLFVMGRMQDVGFWMQEVFPFLGTG